MPISHVENIDCMIAMQKFPNQFFDLAIVDGPYGIGEDGGKTRNGKQSRLKNIKPIDYAKKDWDSESISKNLLDEISRVSKNQIIWGANHFIENISKNSPCWIVWDKKTNDGSDFADCELAWSSFDTAVRKFKYDWVGFGYINNPHGEKKIHPTQKPIALYHWLLKNYAKPGDRILDTHMGSQSSRIAAYKMGFDYWGYEIDEQYFREGCERFDKAIAEPLFDNVKPEQQTFF